MGRINGSVSRRADSYSYYIDWSESDVSVNNNSSVVSATAYIYCSAHNAWASGLSQSLTIDGTTFTDTKTVDLSPGVTVALVSGSKTVYHNNDGTKSITISASSSLPYGSGWGPDSGSASGTVGLTNIPRQATITGAVDFNSDGNPYMTFSNPGGLEIDCYLEFGGTNIVKYNVPNTGNYTFNLTQAERDLLYSKCPNSNTLTVRYGVQTRISGTPTWWSWTDRTMYVRNSNPTFSNFTYADTGTISTQYTGNNQIVIKNYNVVQITISTANKATARNGASMSRYRAVCGSLSAEANYSSSSNVTLSLGYIKNKSITVYAIDSRGNSTQVAKTITDSNWRDYFDPSITQASVTRDGGVNTSTILSFQAKYWKTGAQYDFGAVANQITTCTYQFKKTNESTYSTAQNITPTTSGQNISFNAYITGDEGTGGVDGFSTSSNYDILITISDKIRTITQKLLLKAGSPAMSIHSQGVSFGAPYDTNIGGVCQIEGSKAIGQDAIFAKANRGSITFTSTWQDVSVGSFSVQNSIGNKLTVSNGKVKVGAGVKKVLAFAINDGFYVGTLSGDKCIHLQKNGSNASDGSYYSSQQGGILPLFTAMRIIEVQENDLIGVSIMSGATGTLDILESYLYVQVVE